MPNVAVIIPCYNEATTIGRVIDDVRAQQFEPIVINDGSTDASAHIIQQKQCVVLTHPINGGLGLSLRTGFLYAQQHRYDFAVTFDADGQHDARDISRLLHTLEQGYDVVVGSRMHDMKGMPFMRRVANKIANVVTRGGHISTDSQSGLRAIRVSALRIMELKARRMAISSEIIEETWRHTLRYAEIAIRPLYTTYSLSKGQNFFVGLRTWAHLVVARFFK